MYGLFRYQYLPPLHAQKLEPVWTFALSKSLKTSHTSPCRSSLSSRGRLGLVCYVHWIWLACTRNSLYCMWRICQCPEDIARLYRSRIIGHPEAAGTPCLWSGCASLWVSSLCVRFASRGTRACSLLCRCPVHRRCKHESVQRRSSDETSVFYS